MREEVYVVGVGMHPFINSEGNMRDMAFVAGMEALKDAGVTFREVDCLYNGSIGENPTVGVVIAKEFGLTGLPINRVENASATGSAAFREAVRQVEGGHCKIAMALAYDDVIKAERRFMAIRNCEGPKIEDFILPAAFFALAAMRRMHDYGTSVETLAKIAAKNWNQARYNPNAIRQPDHEVTAEEVLCSRMMAYPLTSMMTCANGAGAACAIVADRETAKRLSRGRPLVKVLASQLRSEEYTKGHVFMGAIIGPFDLTRSTAKLAYEEAGIGPKDLDFVHVHDAFPIEELIYSELLGICADGEGDRLVDEGATSLGGRIPFSTDGGLIARGHPGGPTGLAQIWDATLQLRGEAGKRQVKDARTSLVQMMGAGSVCAIHVLQRV